jgi:hypothetical protein
MTVSTKRTSLVAGACAMAVLALGSPASAAPGGSTGPSSSDAPYLVRQVPGVTLTSILTAGDTVNGYRMAGTPDGLGAFDNGDGTFTLLVNHEFGSAAGVPRAHGGTGAFVSRYVVDKATLRVLSGSDQIRQLVTTGSQNLNRLCSADLPATSAFYNAATGLGYDGRIFMNGEEAAPNGRAFGHVVDTGVSYELPALGKAGWENVVANPATGDKTTVVGQSDGGTQNVYVYSGTKQATGTPVDQAGLTNGTRGSILVAGLPVEDGAQPLPDGPLNFTVTAPGVLGTTFDRPEDGSWDPTNPNVYYFVTTAAFGEHSRLWRATFTDAANPSLGGTIERVLEGPSVATEGPHMMDNITVNDRGQLIILEDVGNNPYLGGVYQFDPGTGALARIAQHDPERFLPGGAYFDTVDEESSGVIPAPFLGAGKYLIDVQNHKPAAQPDVVEKGQLLLMTIPAGRPVAQSAALSR